MFDRSLAAERERPCLSRFQQSSTGGYTAQVFGKLPSPHQLWKPHGYEQPAHRGNGSRLKQYLRHRIKKGVPRYPLDRVSWSVASQQICRHSITQHLGKRHGRASSAKHPAVPHSMVRIHLNDSHLTVDPPWRETVPTAEMICASSNIPGSSVVEDRPASEALGDPRVWRSTALTYRRFSHYEHMHKSSSVCIRARLLARFCAAQEPWRYRR